MSGHSVNPTKTPDENQDNEADNASTALINGASGEPESNSSNDEDDGEPLSKRQRLISWLELSNNPAGYYVADTDSVSEIEDDDDEDDDDDGGDITDDNSIDIFENDLDQFYPD